jgi:Arylsulfotransferase (ASST)
MRWTRGEFVRRSAGSGLGLLLAGGLDARALAATPAKEPDETRRYVTRPDLHPPIVKIQHATGKAAAGGLFIAPSSGAGQRGTLIIDDTGEPQWFQPSTPVTAMNFRAGLYKGKPVLTWWEGSTARGLGTGTHVIVDQSYKEVARMPAGGGRPSDLHEFVLTSRGTALVTSWEIATVNGQRVVGGLVQEIEIPSARVLFEWRSLDHVAIEETHAIENGGALDYFHINSIDEDHDGNFLVSARNTWAIYKINRTTGEVMWRLGGRKSDFKMGKGTVFAWQHDARHHGTSSISLFDDSSAPQVAPQSRGLVIKLDTANMHATLHRQYVHKPVALSHALGSMQVLPNGHVLVGWGTEPWFTEYGPDGTVHLDAKLPKGGQNYRAFRFPWIGKPAEPPRLKVLSEHGHRTVYVSWNGATEVASWRLESGPSRTKLANATTIRKHSFESAFPPLGPDDRYGAVIALDRHGKALGRSTVARVTT